MKKVNNFLNEKKGYFLSFFIPLLVLVFLFTTMKVFFFDKYNLLISDMFGQYHPFFQYLKDALLGDQSFAYSSSLGLGSGMIGTIAYYLISPFNLLILLFSDEKMVLAMQLIIVLKISMCGLTMFTYLKHHYPKQSNLKLLIFSSSYALMGYIACYYFHIMWLDGIYLLPLVCLGIDVILSKRKPVLYGVTLFLSILCNYYIGYMICIFAVIYFLYRLFLNFRWHKDKAKMIKAIIQFGITSLLSGLSTAIILVPTFFSMLETSKMMGIGDLEPFTFHFPFITYISKLVLGSHNQADILVKNGCVIYCGTIVFILSLLYFLNPKFKRKEKWCTFFVILFFLCSLSNNYLNLFWHVGTEPVFFFDRFTFLYCFFLIIIAARSFFEIRSLKPIHFWILTPILPILFLFLFFFSIPYLKTYAIYITVAFYFIYLLLLLCYVKYRDSKIHRLLDWMILGLVIGELVLNFHLGVQDFNLQTQKENYDSFAFMEQVKNEINEKDNDLFYRMETQNSYSSNDGLLFGYPGVSVFASTVQKDMANVYKNFGFQGQDYTFQYQSGTTPVVDSLLGLKYLIGVDIPYYDAMASFRFSSYRGFFYGLSETEYDLYQNSYALPLGFLTRNDVKMFGQKFLDIDNKNYFTYQNFLLQIMTGLDEEVFKPISMIKEDDNRYKIKVENDQDFYLTLFADFYFYQDLQIEIKVNGEVIANIQYPDIPNYIFIENSSQIGEEIELEINSELPYQMILYSFDLDAFQKHIEELKQQPMELFSYQDGYVKGKVTVTSEKNVLFTSIPYEEGWQIKVDGKKVEGLKLAEGLLGVELTEGEHIVEFTYHVPGLLQGFVISFISILLGIWYYKKRDLIDTQLANFYLKHEEIWNYLIVGALTTVVNVVVYAIFTKLLSIHYMVSTVIAWILSVLFAYVANKKVVFKSKVKDRKDLWKEIENFFQFRVLSLFLEMGSMYLLVSLLSVQDLLSKILVNIMVIIANYFFSKLFVFKKE